MNRISEVLAINVFGRHHLLLVLSVASAIALIITGTMKIKGFWILALFFESKYGLPLWFMFFVGYAELFGAISLFLRRWALYGSLGLLTILAGASAFHLVADDPIEMAGMAYALTAAMLAIFLYHWAYRSAEE